MRAAHWLDCAFYLSAAYLSFGFAAFNLAGRDDDSFSPGFAKNSQQIYVDWPAVTSDQYDYQFLPNH